MTLARPLLAWKLDAMAAPWACYCVENQRGRKLDAITAT